MTTSLVSHYNFLQTGAPSLTGTVGAGITLYDAVLVNGWGSQTATSLVVSGTIATLTLPATPAMIPNGLMTIAGATLTGFVNGIYKVATVVGNVVTFIVSGVTAGTATGTITAKVSSLGWNKVYSGTNLAVYQSANVAATTCYLRVDDTAAQVMRVVMYESMTDVNTGVGPTPTTAQISGGGYWGKSNTADSTARQWHIVGDDRTVYMAFGTSNTASLSTNTNGQLAHFWGDIIPLNTADTSFSAIIGCFATATPYTSASSDPSQYDVVNTFGTSQSGKYIPRSYTQVGGSIGVGIVNRGIPSGNVGGVGSSGTFSVTYPNPANNGLILGHISVFEGTGGVVRGDLPGVYFCSQNLIGFPFANRDTVAGTGSLAGRNLMYVRTGGPASAGLNGAVFFDVTGPWR